MRFHRTAPVRAFAGFSAALLRDRSISWCAVSVLTYLLTLPDDARVSIRGLAARRPQGRGRIAAALRELEELRYLRRVVSRRGMWGRLRVRYEVFDAPYEPDPPMGETEKIGDRYTPSRRNVPAAHLLLSLGQIDRRLTLDADQALRLAPLVDEWWRRGASDFQVRMALAYGCSGRVHSVPAHLEALLRSKCPVRSTPLPVTAVEVKGRPVFA